MIPQVPRGHRPIAARDVAARDSGHRPGAARPRSRELHPRAGQFKGPWRARPGTPGNGGFARTPGNARLPQRLDVRVLDDPLLGGDRRQPDVPAPQLAQWRHYGQPVIVDDRGVPDQRVLLDERPRG